ncbi:MAG: ATP-binding cassette domain-containing protein, partial [Gammaproteobacteria bacterium]|nr:ATP-binding cassette domain-containing protein [Gammaproteobacteria bacterium]
LVSQSRRHSRHRVHALLDAVGLSHRRKAYPATLSGGEQQRVAIARALVNEPRLVLADEPTGNLDSHLGQEIMMLLYDIAREDDRAVLIVTHDARIEEVADRILCLEGGRLRDRKARAHQWAVCPVCSMRVDAWTATVRLEHGGIEHIFCSKRCRDRFVTQHEAKP